jgi:hypothetical protein
MDSLALNDRFLEGSFPIIPGTGPEIGQFSVHASEKVAHRPPLVSRDHGVEVSKRSDQLAAQVGDRVQPALEGERLRCLWVAGERTINVELAIGQQAIDGPPDLAVS